ncbi:MAG: NAD(P)H-dependent oxidoreductase [Burkholderiaceae bacterium]
MTVRILCMAASLRRASLNKKLARACAVSAELLGAHARVVDLRDYPMPLYDGDIEAADGVPATAALLAGQVIEADALIIASPEYNGGPPAVLKNSLDWMTRLGKADGEPAGRTVLALKPTLLVSASPGALGGLRGSIVARLMLSQMGLQLLPMTVAVGQAGQAFSPDGQLTDGSLQRSMESAIQQLILLAGPRG